MSRTLWREMLYDELKTVPLSGDVIDLGGSRRSGYHGLFPGTQKWSVVNLEAGEGIDHAFDLEEPFPLGDATYDGVVCLNVLEHIFNYQNVLRETRRIMRPGATFVLAVPFLIQLHPSPHDHWRFSKETLERLLRDAGFRDVEVRTIGTGLFGASHQLFFNFYRFSFVQSLCKVIARLNDWALARLWRGNRFSKEYYPLGYLVLART